MTTQQSIATAQGNGQTTATTPQIGYVDEWNNHEMLKVEARAWNVAVFLLEYMDRFLSMALTEIPADELRVCMLEIIPKPPGWSLHGDLTHHGKALTLLGLKSRQATCTRFRGCWMISLSDETKRKCREYLAKRPKSLAPDGVVTAEHFRELMRNFGA